MNDDRPPTFVEQIVSVLAAFFGVQSRRNRERDFKHGRAVNYIVIGLLMTALLVLALVFVVRLALHQLA